MRKKKKKNTKTRVIIVPLTIDKKTHWLLTCARREAAVIWNTCVQLAEYYYFNGKYWITEKELRKMLSGHFKLHSQSVQNVIEQYCTNRENTTVLRSQGLTDWKYPWKTKHYFPVTWSYQGIELKNKTITLKMGRGHDPITLKLPVKLPKVNLVELVYQNNRYYLHCAITTEIAKPEKASQEASVDMGEIHAMALTDGSDALIVSGRKLRSIKQYRAKKLAEIQRAMSKLKKGSRKWKKLIKCKKKLLSKASRQIHDLNHKITRQAADWCVEHNIKKVYIGDLDGIQRNTSNKKTNPKKKRRSKKLNQKISTWEFGKQTRLLKYKLADNNISLKKEDESYTTQSCPECDHRHKPRGRAYKCRCGYTEHRDVVGALNLLRKSIYGKLTPQPTPKINIKYLRPGASRKVVVPPVPEALSSVG